MFTGIKIEENPHNKVKLQSVGLFDFLEVKVQTIQQEIMYVHSTIGIFLFLKGVAYVG